MLIYPTVKQLLRNLKLKNQSQYRNIFELFAFKDIKKYDNKGNIIEDVDYKDGSFLSSKKTFKYDDKGNEIEESWYKSDGSLWMAHNQIYEYDSKSNWIKKIEFKVENEVFKIPTTITEREIQYYD